MEFASVFTTESSRWQAVLSRDPQAEDSFVYAVITTSVYCRPTCPSRKPNRDNVYFFDTWAAAEENGFRPCRRCRPQMSNVQEPIIRAVTRACQMIAEAEGQPSLHELADAVGFSAWHFHRIFKKVLGVTPKQYAMENRLQRMRENLPKSSSVTAAVYQTGFASASRFYENAEQALGMKPSAFKKGGRDVVIRWAVAHSYLGWVLVAATEQGLCRIDFDDSPEALTVRLKSCFPAARLVEDDREFQTVVKQILAFLEEPRQGLSLPLDIQGTAFQRRVWAALRDIPPGITVSYSQIARQIGKPRAARAVAQACAANLLAVAIPCHRVVRGDGGLAGYRWGVGRKKALLQREATGE